MKKLFYEILARLGFWIPCNKYMPNPKYWDWVLVSYYEPGLVYRYIPIVAEYSYTLKSWHTTQSDFAHEEFMNKMCKITHWRRIPNDSHLKIDVMLPDALYKARELPSLTSNENNVR